MVHDFAVRMSEIIHIMFFAQDVTSPQQVLANAVIIMIRLPAASLCLGGSAAHVFGRAP